MPDTHTNAEINPETNTPATPWPEATEPLRVSELWVYPVKSCAGVRLPRAQLLDTGLEWDRTWMVVDERGEFVSQRECPRMALVQPQFRLGHLVLRAPGMLALHLQLDAAEAPTRVRVWDDELDAYDMGPVAAQWITDALGAGAGSAHGLGRLRLVRFAPEITRQASRKWTEGRDAPLHFADGYPLLVCTAAALDGLNQRLTQAGQAAVDWRRFRPNIVLSGPQPHDEDHWAHVVLGTPEQGAWLQPVKPCARCSIPDVDPDTAAAGSAVAQALAGYRSDSRLDGALTFGMNAIVRAGAPTELFEGQTGAAAWPAWR